MSPTLWTMALATALAAAGMWLLLPRQSVRGRFAGLASALLAAGIWIGQLPPVGSALTQAVFWLLAAVAVAAAVATISCSNPVYSAIWFGLSLLGTAGLFLYQGAQFLAMAIVVVYAGAILVTFLFVLMLAQPQGRAYYDRVSWEAMLSAALGAILVGVLTATLSASMPATESAAGPAAAARAERILAPDHVAQLGAELFGRHLLAVQIAGVLLMAALVGAAAIVAQSSAKESAVSEPNPGPARSTAAPGGTRR